MESKSLHRECFVCGEQNSRGLGVRFEISPEGGATARFAFPAHMCGYPGRVQGGMVSAVLDSAMANALLLQGIVAYTARLEVRFLKPVLPEAECLVIGVATQQKLRLHSLEARLFQSDVLVASATSVFFEPGLEGNEL